MWKTATGCFLRVVKECVGPLQAMGKAVSEERIEGIWRQLLDVFRGGILADWYVLSTFRFDGVNALSVPLPNPSRSKSKRKKKTWTFILFLLEF